MFGGGGLIPMKPGTVVRNSHNGKRLSPLEGPGGFEKAQGKRRYKLNGCVQE
jgi:hypothetical protein